VVREHAAQFGCPVEMIPLPNLGSLADNARQICNWLKRRRDAPIILVSLSKGGSDVKCALARPDASLAFRNVALWFNLSGMLSGTPLIAWLSQTRSAADVRDACYAGGATILISSVNWITAPARRLTSNCECRRTCRQFILLVSRSAGTPTNRLSRRNHARLEPHGPNDGAGILLADAVGWPGCSTRSGAPIIICARRP